MIKPFSPPYSGDAIEDLRSRIRRTRWPDEVPDSGWDYGIDPAFLREVCDYWAEKFEWSDQVGSFSAFPHFMATISGHSLGGFGGALTPGFRVVVVSGWAYLRPLSGLTLPTKFH